MAFIYIIYNFFWEFIFLDCLCLFAKKIDEKQVRKCGKGEEFSSSEFPISFRKVGIKRKLRAKFLFTCSIILCGPKELTLTATSISSLLLVNLSLIRQIYI